MNAFLKSGLFLLMLAGLPACVAFPDAPPRSRDAALTETSLIAYDGAALSVTAWPARDPGPVLIAVHGMNDYANSFALPGEWWAQNASITTYAYDQRGFGRSPDRARWVGSKTLRADLLAAIDATRARHPASPVYVLGHSMGAAVVLSAMAETPLPVEGVIIAAPGVWGGSQMPLLYRLSANAAAVFAPGKTLTGERAGRQATDNIDILRQMQRDPNIVKETRIKSVLGVTRIMGEAYDATDEVGGRVLFLYGEKDEIIPVKAMKKAAGRLCGAVTVRVYPDGWHMLFRDLQRQRVWRDVADWINGADADRKALGGAGPEQTHCGSASQLQN